MDGLLLGLLVAAACVPFGLLLVYVEARLRRIAAERRYLERRRRRGGYLLPPHDEEHVGRRPW